MAMLATASTTTQARATNHLILTAAKLASG
jgi:hypothetical protein